MSADIDTGRSVRLTANRSVRPGALPSLDSPSGRAPVRRVALALIVIVMFGVSGGLLWSVGLNYDGLSGSAAAKIHPSTYLIVMLFGWMAIMSGDIIGFCGDVASRRPGACFLLITTVIYFVSVVLRQAPGMAGVVDTFLPAALIVLILSRANDRNLLDIEIILHLIMTINALMALVEFGTGHLVFPYRFDGDVFATDLRSTALQGHPLVNATITCWYVMAVIGGGGRTLSPNMRGAIFVLQFLGLVAFGGRIALVTTAILGGGTYLLKAHRILINGRVSLIASAITVLTITIVPAIVAALVMGGFFDAVWSRFVSDGGSANARIEMFDIFGYLTFRDLLLGPDTDLVDSVRRVAGLEWGIENPIIRTLLYQGILVTLMQTVAVVIFLTEMVRKSRSGTFLPMLAFAIVMNTSESIGGKTTMLTKFAVTMFALYVPGPRISDVFSRARGTRASIDRSVVSHRP